MSVLGRGYIIDHCVSCLNKSAKEEVFKSYVTDTLKIISSNTGKMVNGEFVTVRYADIINDTQVEDEVPDEIKAEEIKRNIRSKLANLSKSRKEDA